MSMVLYTSPEVGCVFMDSFPENNTNDVYGISIWYFSKEAVCGLFRLEASAQLLCRTTCWRIRV